MPAVSHFRIYGYHREMPGSSFCSVPHVTEDIVKCVWASIYLTPSPLLPMNLFEDCYKPDEVFASYIDMYHIKFSGSTVVQISQNPIINIIWPKAFLVFCRISVAK